MRATPTQSNANHAQYFSYFLMGGSMKKSVFKKTVLFIELANKSEKVCLTLDCSGNILNGPRKFRTEAGNPDSQTCYFNVINNEQLFSVYIS